MEEKYTASPARKRGDMSLSKAIKERSNQMKQIDDVTLLEGESDVAAAAFMVLASI
jgi:hypothetical protein